MKKIIVTYLLLAGLFIVSFRGFCQQKKPGVGDPCPDILMKPIINYKVSQARISDFKGKLLILDFWATWCAPCLSMMPVADALQKKFDGRIQILPVTDQDSATVAPFLKNMARMKHIQPPCVTGDFVLKELFTHSVIPHYVWIDQNSIVIAITNEDELTEATINKFLGGNAPGLPVKNDVIKIIDNNKPMFGIGYDLIEPTGTRFEKTPDSDLMYHSVITRYIDGFGCESGTTSTLINAKNNSIGGLYRIAAGHDELKKLMLNSTIWEVTNPSLKEYTDSACVSKNTRWAIDAWNKNYTFCYELKFPVVLNNRKFDIMLADLNNYFGTLYHIRGGLERRKAPCLSLVRTTKSVVFAGKGKVETNLVNAYRLKLTGNTMNALVNFLGMRLDLYPPIEDATNYKGKIDIDLDCDLSDLNSVNEALAKYGLQLLKKEIEREVIVIRDTR